MLPHTKPSLSPFSPNIVPPLLSDVGKKKKRSTYNTYIYEGLPPGPIACPGKASLEAALNPAKTDYIYFVVSDKGDGSMKFSKDYDEFLKNKEDYYASVEGK